MMPKPSGQTEGHDLDITRATSARNEDIEPITKEHPAYTPVEQVHFSEGGTPDGADQRKKKKWYAMFLVPGSAPQIIVAALIAVGIGMAVNMTVDKVPPAVISIVGIPGRLWIRGLTAIGKSQYQSLKYKVLKSQ